MKAARIFTAVVLCLSATAPMATGAHASNTISQVDWESGRVVKAGKAFHVSVFSRSSFDKCRMTFRGKSKRSVTFNPAGRSKISTRRIPAGKYETSLKCGKRATPFATGPAIIVPKGKSRNPTCDLVEYGVTSNSRGDTSIGMILRNSNPYVGVGSITIVANLINSQGSIISTETELLRGMGPGTDRIAGWNLYGSSEDVASIELRTDCRGQGSAYWPEYVNVPAQPAERGAWLEPTGTITNDARRTFSGLESKIVLLTRDSSGQITGGDETSLAEADVPPGATVRWSGSIPALRGTGTTYAATVQAQFSPEFIER